jgi:hypothetical protein
MTFRPGVIREPHNWTLFWWRFELSYDFAWGHARTIDLTRYGPNMSGVVWTFRLQIEWHRSP